jgi:hypothetical protein
MQTLVNIALAVMMLSVLAGCQNNVTNAELNQCAQQNYQCESNCKQQSTAESLKEQVCSAKCIESYNYCKVQAEKLGS